MRDDDGRRGFSRRSGPERSGKSRKGKEGKQGIMGFEGFSGSVMMEPETSKMEPADGRRLVDAEEVLGMAFEYGPDDILGEMLEGMLEFCEVSFEKISLVLSEPMTPIPLSEPEDEICLEDVVRDILASSPCTCREDDGAVTEVAVTPTACQEGPVGKGAVNPFGGFPEGGFDGAPKKKRLVGLKRAAELKRKRPVRSNRHYRRCAASAGIPVIDESLQAYSSAIGKMEQLTAKEEADLARKIRAGRMAAIHIDAADMLRAFRPDQRIPFERRQQERIEQAGIDARQQLVTANLRLVVSIAEEYADDGLALPELVRQGNIGLIGAVDSFEPDEMGCRFQDYATWWVHHAIVKEFFDQPSGALRFPEHAEETLKELMRVHRQLSQSLGRDAAPEEIVEKMAAGMAEGACPLSLLEATVLQAVIGPEDDSDQDPFESTFISKSLRKILVDVVNKELNALEHEVIVLEYGLEEGCTPCTLEEIADRNGLERGCVCQIERNAFDKLQGHPHIGWMFRGFLGDDSTVGYRAMGSEDR